MMGILSEDDVTESYHKLVDPRLTGCRSDSEGLVCPEGQAAVTARETISFGVWDLVTRYGSWSARTRFEPRNLQIGVLNVSDRRHTEAEIVWFSKLYRDYATSEQARGRWVEDTPWQWSTRGLGQIEIDVRNMSPR